MQLRDELELTGELEILVIAEDGSLKERRVVPNLVVTAGKNWWAARGTSAPPAAMSHMAVGSGSVAPAAGDTALGGELGRVALSSQTAAGNVVTYSATFAAGVGTGSLTEAGIFNAATGGTMLNRATFGVITKAAGDSMQINWTVTQQ